MASSTQVSDNPGQAREQLEVEEDNVTDENITYPSGPKLWLTMASLCIAYFLNGLVGFLTTRVNGWQGTNRFRTSPSWRWQCQA